METKLVIIPHLVIGSTVINYYCESYYTDYVCTNSGVPARNGWHIQPAYALRWNKKPSRSFYATQKEMEKFRDIYDFVEVIK